MDWHVPSYHLLDPEKTKVVQKFFKGEKIVRIQVGEKKWILPYKYTEQGEEFFKFKARPSDIWVVSHPRSGKIFWHIFSIIFFLKYIW